MKDFRSNETVEKAEVEEKNLTSYILMEIIVILWIKLLLSRLKFQNL